MTSPPSGSSSASTPAPPSGRQRALRAALEVLHSSGQDAVTMRAVADQAGITATAIYRHFRDKDQLLHEMSREVGAVFRDHLAPALDRDDPWERLLGLIIGARTFALDCPRYYEFWFLTRRSRAPRYPADFHPAPGDLAVLSDAIQRCMDAGILAPDDPVDVALDLSAHLHGLVRLWWLDRFGSDRSTFEAFVDASFARQFAGLAARRMKPALRSVRMRS